MWSHILEVFSPRDLLIGRIIQEFSLFSVKFRVEDELCNTLYHIKQRKNFCESTSMLEFSVREANPQNNEICRIITDRAPQSIYSDLQDLAIHFITPVDVKGKALLLSSCVFFYIYYRYVGRHQSRWEHIHNWSHWCPWFDHLINSINFLTTSWL